MILEETRSALQALFPEPPKVEETVETTEETTESTEDASAEKAEESPAEEKKEEPRVNGVVDREYAVHGYHLDAQVDPGQLLEAVGILDKREFFLETITGVDWINDGQFEVIYDFSRYDFDVCRVVIRARIPREEPVIPTITPIYTGANWHERETHDFFGIKFDGHPHLVPLLLPEDADFHPLRKDYKA